MSKQKIKQLIENKTKNNGIVETGIKGVQLFRGTEPFYRIPAVVKPTVTAIVNGAKEAILDGESYVYDSSKYMCCTEAMPLEVGTLTVSQDNPLLGINISLDTKVIAEIITEMESNEVVIRTPVLGTQTKGLILADWDDAFTDALLRLLQLMDSPELASIFGDDRLREVYYAILKGDAGETAKRAFTVRNDMVKSIVYSPFHLDKTALASDSTSATPFTRKFKYMHGKFSRLWRLSRQQKTK